MHDQSTPNHNSVPYGYCHCGCGQKTRISPRTDRTYGYVQGEPRKYVLGHNGKTQPNEWQWDDTQECYRVSLPSDDYMLVDASDMDIAKQFHWQVNTQRGKTGYVFHTRKKGDGTSGSVYLHRLLTDAPIDKVVDHINGDGRDNRRHNLRICSNTENQRNRNGLSTASKSGFTGVCFPSKGSKWQASIGAHGRNIYLGAFYCPIEAAIARDVAALELHGEFASLNFPELREVLS